MLLTILDVGVLIERSAELSVVRDRLARAASGRGGTVVLSGGAGSGRSALVRHVRESAAALRFHVLDSRLTPVSVSHPQAVVRNWLAPLARGLGPGERPFDGPATGLADALRSGSPDHPAWDVARLDYALTWLLENLTDTRPVLLVVDDVQWADVGSLGLLDLLSARLDRSRAVLVLALRTGEPVRAADILDRVLGRATVLSPAPLTVQGVDQLLREPAERPAASLGAEGLHRLTGGNPLLVREMLRADRVDEVPRSIVDWMGDRLSRLDATTVALARTVAALGDEASLDALAALLNLSVAGLADPLEVLSAAGLVKLGMWRAWPAHPLLADAVLASMPPSGRSALHRRAADHLARTRRPRQAIAAQLLHTLPGEDSDVVDVLRAAAAESLADGAPAVAARQLLRAVGETRPEDTDPTLVAQAAAAHGTAGLREQALHLWRQAQDRAASPDQRAGWLTDMGDVQLTLGDHDAARASYGSALRVLGDAGHDRTSPHMRRVHARAGLARAWYDGLAVDLTGILTEATARPQAEDIHADRLLFALAACQLALHGEDRDCARSLALRALGDGGLLREETADGPGFLAAAAVLTWADSYEEAMRVLDAAVDDSHARGSTLGLGVASTGLGLVHLRQGRLGEALTCFDLALQRREEGWESYGGPALAGTVVGLLSAGRIQEACALEHDLRRLSPCGGSGGAQPAAAAGLVRATYGDHVQALAEYRRAATLMGGFPDNASVVAWRELSVWSLLALGRRAEAEEMAAEALAHARHWGAPRALGFALRTRARVLPPEDAEAHLREAIDLLRSAGIVELTARAEVDLGRLLLPDGPRRAEAVHLLHAGAERARTAGAQPVARRAARLLARLGMRLDPGGESPLAALTRGERRVVELAASGLTNREIAQRLVVTVKAVEWHLSNAYRKLAVSSRVQLAGVLYGSSSSDR